MAEVYRLWGGGLAAVGVDITLDDPAKLAAQVRNTPSWPRCWANFSLLSLCSHRNVWANLCPLDQPNTSLAAVAGTTIA
jgi:hypothetical protein